MYLSNLDAIPGKKIATHYGMVAGSVVLTKHIGVDILATFRNLFGGEVNSYSQLLKEAHTTAMNRMVKQAAYAGANGVVNIRLSTSPITSHASEIIVYGTAVKVV